MPENNKTIVSSLNKSLNYLTSKAALNGFKAIVANDGTGHYTKISDAVAAGEKYIFVKNGNYEEDTDIELSGVTIVGQSPHNVIINLTNATIKLSDNIHSTTAGTIKPVNADASIFGVGTSFNALAADTNKYIFSELFLAEIGTISDNLNLELITKYYGPSTDQDGINFSLSHQSFSNANIGSSIQNITINHILTNPKSCIEIQGIKNSITNVFFKNTNNLSTFILLPSSATELAIFSSVKSCKFDGGGTAIKLFSSTFTTIYDNIFFGLSDACIELTANATKTDIKKNVFTGSEKAISYSGAANGTNINDCYFTSINQHAINIDLGGAEIFSTISNCEFSQCNPGDKTITINASNLKLINNIFHNGTTQLYIRNTKNLEISGNKFYDWQSRAILVNSTDTQENTIYTNNHFIAESAKTWTEAGVKIYGDSVIFSNNTFANIEDEAVLFLANNSIFSHNTFKDCDANLINISGNFNNISKNNIINSYTAIILTGNDCCLDGNIIQNDGATAIYVTGSRAIVTGNKVDVATTNGIEIHTTADRIIITSNISLNCGTNLVNNGTNTSVNNNITT